MAVETPVENLDVKYIATATPFSWIEKYDHEAAPIQTKPDWKDLLIAGFSIPSLATLIYFAIINSR